MTAMLTMPAPSAGSDVGGEGGEGAILLVESDARIGQELLEQLRADGYHAVHARTARHARTLARDHPIRAALLGRLDSSRGTLDLLTEIRHAAAAPAGGRSPWDERLPAIVLRAQGEPLELLRAFEAGADDFIGGDEPSYLELRARLRALLRRVECPRERRLLSVGVLEIDTGAHIVRIAAAPVELSRLEYALLVHLARSPHRVCSKQELLRAIWGHAAVQGGRTVDSHASRLRRKLEAAGAPGLVVNVWATGYRLT
jgi:DNA-binding response OmpR family regulator